LEMFASSRTATVSLRARAPAPIRRSNCERECRAISFAASPPGQNACHDLCRRPRGRQSNVRQIRYSNSDGGVGTGAINFVGNQKPLLSDKRD
jgi:hypothetical protein